MSAIAIVGAGGFVGTSLIESLVLSGNTGARAVVRSYRNMAGFCRFGDAVEVKLADATREAALVKAFAGASVVVNVTTGPPAGIVESTRAIYNACRTAGVTRFVHLSSAVVYGDVERPIDDDAMPLDKHWMPYARAKAESERWLRTQTHPGLEVVVLRPGIVWGVRSPHTLGFARSLAGKSSFLVDGGAHVFNGVYIANLVAMIRAACDAPGEVAGFYNAGDAERVTWREFYDALGGALGCDPAQLPLVSGEKFPWSTGAVIDAVQSLGPVNALYHKLKTRIPDGLKAAIRARLEGAYSFDRHATTYTSVASVNRELWHLQRVRHKLPVHKFAARFGFVTPVSFPEAIRRTITWIETLGLAVAQPQSSVEFSKASNE
ncbi:MAG: NAD(P)-dependent oxidoreductase [Pseudomonadota bacterium]